MLLGLGCRLTKAAVCAGRGNAFKTFHGGGCLGCPDPLAEHSRDTDTEPTAHETEPPPWEARQASAALDVMWFLKQQKRTAVSRSQSTVPWGGGPLSLSLSQNSYQRSEGPRAWEKAKDHISNDQQIQARNKTCHPAVFQTLSMWNTAVTKGLRNVPNTLVSHSKQFCLQKHDVSHMCASMLSKKHIKMKTGKIILIHFT